MEKRSSGSSGVFRTELAEMLARVAEALDGVRDQLLRIELRLALAPLPSSPPSAGPDDP